MSDLVIPRWPKRSLLDDPEEEARAAALIASRRAGMVDEDEEAWLGLRPPLGSAPDATAADESGPFLDYSRASPRPNSRPPRAAGAERNRPSPSVGRSLLNHHIDTYLATTQGLSERDLRAAVPLPDALSRFVLKPGEGSLATLNELHPLVDDDARKLGLEIVVRRTGDSGELGFALRPEASSKVLDDDQPGARIVNRAAQIADGLGRLFGLNAAGPAGGGLETGRAAARATKATTPSREAAVALTGKELGELGDDLRAWIAAGSDAYKKIRNAGLVTNPTIGDVRFTGVGLDKMRFTGADRRKWQLVPALPKIIHTGELINTTAVPERRTDGIVRFHWLETNVMLNGEPLRVGTHIAEDAHGKKFYNLNQDLDAWARKNQPPGTGRLTIPGRQGAAGGKASATADIGPSSDGINLYILGPATLGATQAQVPGGEAE